MPRQGLGKQTGMAQICLGAWKHLSSVDDQQSNVDFASWCYLNSTDVIYLSPLAVEEGLGE